MHIEEVKRLKVALTADVTELIVRFQKQTGCVVTQVSIEHFFTDADAQPITTKAEIKIELP